MSNAGSNLATVPARGVVRQSVIDRERDQLVECLNEAYAGSLVDAVEHGALLDLLFEAHTQAELALVAEQLPIPESHRALAAVARRAPQPWRVQLMTGIAFCGTLAIALICLLSIGGAGN